MKREKNRYTLPKEKRDKGFTLLGFAFIVVFIIAIVLVASLITANAKNGKLDRIIANQELIISELTKKVTESNTTITAYDEKMKQLYKVIDDLELEISKLTADNIFLGEWSKKIANRLGKTIDFRGLTSMKCDGIVPWLFKQMEKYREFEKR